MSKHVEVVTELGAAAVERATRQGQARLTRTAPKHLTGKLFLTASPITHGCRTSPRGPVN